MAMRASSQALLEARNCSGDVSYSMYLFSFRTRRALGAGESSVTLLTLLTRRSNESNQTWMAL